MKTSIDQYEFASWFAEHRPNNFSPIGRLELYEMLKSYEEDTEYQKMEEFWQDYDKKEYPDEESIMDATFYWAFENGDSFIIQRF